MFITNKLYNSGYDYHVDPPSTEQRSTAMGNGSISMGLYRGAISIIIVLYNVTYYTINVHNG